jgi:uncharacterized cupredoxin-like copper-binding protein
MNSFHYYILFSLIIEMVIILFISYKKKNKILPMHGMVITMAFAMNIGLTIGVLFGSLHQGNLFFSTIISMFSGILVGLLCGIGLGLLSTVEGSMTAMMGGMMGAMLGEMIQISQSSVLLIILLTFSICSLLMYLIFPNKDKKDNKIDNWLWFIKPLLILVVLSSYLLFGFTLSKEVISIRHKSKNIKDETIIRLETSGLKYSPTSFVVNKGQQISLILDNVDSIEHDFEIKRINITNININTHHSDNLSKSTIHLHGQPKSKSELKFVPLDSGTYEFYCTIPGHKAAGMKGIMKVSDGVN